MENIIKITETERGVLVSSRELYDFLGFAPQHWAKWYKKNIINDIFFEENKDYTQLPLSGSNKSIDFAISIEMAKEISMLARTEKGKEARQYFIACEQKLKETKKNILKVPENFREALLLAAEQQLVIEKQETVIKKLEPRSLYFDHMITTDGLVSMQEVAKLLNIKDMGRTKLYEELRKGNVIMKNSTVPYQHFVNKGYFELKEEIVILKGNVRKVNVVTWVTQKGLAFIFKFFGLTENKTTN